MDDRQAGEGRLSRRAGLRGLLAPADGDCYVADSPPLLDVISQLGEPRIAELDALLREVDGLRTTLRRDLSLAATALSAGAEDMANWLLLDDGGEVRSFEERALAHLRTIDAPAHHRPEGAAVSTGPRRRMSAHGRGRWLTPAAPLVATAAAVIGLLTGVVPSPGLHSPTSPQTSNAALQSYDQLTQLASTGASLSSISAAARRFHAALAPLVAAASSNPAVAERAIAMLQGERAVIASEGDSAALQDVLAQADALVLRLQAVLPHPTSVLVPAEPAAHSRAHRTSTSGANSSPSTQPAPTPAATTSPTASAAPSASASPSTTPSPSSSPKPSASPRSSASPSPSGYPIPRAPGLQPL